MCRGGGGYVWDDEDDMEEGEGNGKGGGEDEDKDDGGEWLFFVEGDGRGRVFERGGGSGG